MPETRVLRQSRKKAALSILGSAAFVAIGILIVTGRMSGSGRYSPEFALLMGWVCVIFFGLTGVLAIRGLIKPTEVILSPEGFKVLGLREKALVRWADVQNFFICQVQRTRIVCYERRGEPTDFQRAMGMNRTGQWGDGQIPAHLELHPDKVLELLEDWRRRYGA